MKIRRFWGVILTLVLSFFLLSGCGKSDDKNQKTTSEQIPKEQVIEKKTPPQPVTNDKVEPSQQTTETKRKPFEYSLGLEPVTPAHVSFESYRNSNLLIFYFSPSCPHCQENVEPFQNLVKELSEKGFRGVAIASGAASIEEIQEFQQKFNVHIPLFKDTQRQVRGQYGTGFVPMVLAVHKDGTFLRFEEYSGSHNSDIKKQVASWGQTGNN